MKIKSIIENRLDEFQALCDKHSVKTLFAFGSATNEHFDEEKSDIDLLIEIDAPDPVERGENLMNIWDALELFFGRKVDLLTDDSIRNPVLRKNIEHTKILIYDREGEKVLI